MNGLNREIKAVAPSNKNKDGDGLEINNDESFG
jgi:hypothetical protein